MGQLQVSIAAEESAEAKTLLARLEKLKGPGDDTVKNEAVRIHRMEQAVLTKKGGQGVDDLQQELRALNDKHKEGDASEKTRALEVLDEIYKLMKENKVKFAQMTQLKVGKDIGNAMKLGDPDLSAAGRKCVGEIQALAQRNAMLG